MKRYPWLNFINASKVFVTAVSAFVLVMVLMGYYPGTEGRVLGTLVSITLISSAVEAVVLWRRRRSPSSRAR